MSRALICGISGQDGSYLALFLLKKGYEICGTSRDVQTADLSNLETLGIAREIKMLSMAPNDFHSTLSAVKRSDPDEIYFLSAQSSVALSFEQPVETLESISGGTLNLLEACRFLDKDVRIYHASSSECFGDTVHIPANEETPFRPRSPYAVAKASAHWLVGNYRDAYSIYACNGILFNHESPLRPARYVTRKITSTAARIACGSNEKLRLGRLNIVRDWGWAPEYVEAMWLMLQQQHPDDYIVATGKSHSLQEFIAKAFASLGMNWMDHVESQPDLYRPSDVTISRADPQRAFDKLGWEASIDMDGVLERMLDWELRRCVP